MTVDIGDYSDDPYNMEQGHVEKHEIDFLVLEHGVVVLHEFGALPPQRL